MAEKTRREIIRAVRAEVRRQRKPYNLMTAIGNTVKRYKYVHPAGRNPVVSLLEALAYWQEAETETAFDGDGLPLEYYGSFGHKMDLAAGLTKKKDILALITRCLDHT